MTINQFCFSPRKVWQWTRQWTNQYETVRKIRWLLAAVLRSRSRPGTRFFSWSWSRCRSKFKFWLGAYIWSWLRSLFWRIINKNDLNKFLQAVVWRQSRSEPRFSVWSLSRYFLHGAEKKILEPEPGKNCSASEHWLTVWHACKFWQKNLKNVSVFDQL